MSVSCSTNNEVIVTEMGPQFKVSSERPEKREIHLAIHELVV